jgi:hypothetical protein
VKNTFNNGLRKVWKKTLVVYCRIGLTLQYFLKETEKKQVRLNMKFENESCRKFNEVIPSFKHNWREKVLFKLNKCPYITYIGYFFLLNPYLASVENILNS